MPRLFTAIKLPPDIALQLSLLRGGLDNARWIEPDDYHITLNFFGDIHRHRARDLVVCLEGTMRQAINLEINALGVFGGNKPRALIAVVAQNETLSELHSAHVTIARTLGLVPDKRKFAPHVTLARLWGARLRGAGLHGTNPEEVARYLSHRGGLLKYHFTADRFHLMSSKASKGGGPYVSEAKYFSDGEVVLQS